MPIEQSFFQPWSELDPSGAHGGIPGELGRMVGPRLGDNLKTRNADCHYLFHHLQLTASSISRHAYADRDDPLPNRMIMQHVIKGVNSLAVILKTRIRTQLDDHVMYSHARPGQQSFSLFPIMFPVRQPWANSVIYRLIGLSVELAENSANDLHAGIPASRGIDLIRHLGKLKQDLMLEFFRLEPQGFVDYRELLQMQATTHQRGAEVTPIGETEPRATNEAVNDHRAGTAVLSWEPNDGDWQKFAELELEMFSAENILQPEGTVFTTEDVAPQTTTSASGGTVPGSMQATASGAVRDNSIQ